MSLIPDNVEWKGVIIYQWNCYSKIQLRRACIWKNQEANLGPDLCHFKLSLGHNDLIIFRVLICSAENVRHSGVSLWNKWSINEGVWTYLSLMGENVSTADMFHVNILRPRQNGHRFADDTFKCIFLNKHVWISIKISLKFVPEGSINNIPAPIQIMAWCRLGDKPLSEPMMALPTELKIKS